MCPQASPLPPAQVKYAWQHQPDEVLNQVNPVSGALYTVLTANDDVRINSIVCVVVWTVQPSPVRVIITIDGQPIIHSMANPATATNYYLDYSPADIIGAQYLTLTIYRIPFWYEGQNISVEASISGGTVQLLYSLVKWAKLLPT